MDSSPHPRPRRETQATKNARQIRANRLRDHLDSAAIVRGLVAGLTYTEIGAALGRPADDVHRLATQAVRAFCERYPIEQLVGLEHTRLERLHAVLWPGAIAGNIESIREVRALSAERRKLFGLDAPTRIAPVDPDGKPLSFTIEFVARPTAGWPRLPTGAADEA